MLAGSDHPWACAGHPDEDGSWAPRMQRRSELFVGAMENHPGATEAWTKLFAQEGAVGLAAYRQLMNTTQSWQVRGRVAVTLGQLTGDYSDARSVLAATLANSKDRQGRSNDSPR